MRWLYSRVPQARQACGSSIAQGHFDSRSFDGRGIGEDEGEGNPHALSVCRCALREAFYIIVFNAMSCTFTPKLPSGSFVWVAVKCVVAI